MLTPFTGRKGADMLTGKVQRLTEKYTAVIFYLISGVKVRPKAQILPVFFIY